MQSTHALLMLTRPLNRLFPRVPASNFSGSAARAVSAVAFVALASLGGCASSTGSAELSLQGEGRERRRLASEFENAAFMPGDSNTSIYLSDVPLEALLDGSATTAQVVHVELLWEPRPGRTPLDQGATNASVRYIVFVDGEVGIFGGAGFVSFRGGLQRSRVKFDVQNASMQLVEATPGFRDLLSPASLSGEVVAVRSEERTLRLRQVISQRVTDAFGETKIVDAAPQWHELIALVRTH